MAITFTILAGLIVSCVSLSDRAIPQSEITTTEIIGTVQTTFTSWQPVYIIMEKSIKSKAYSRLLEQARFEFGNNVDVINIKITGGFSAHNIWLIGLAAGLGFNIGTMTGDYMLNSPIGTPITVIAGDVQKITATGDVVAAGAISQTRPQATIRPNTSNTTAIERTVYASGRIQSAAAKLPSYAQLDFFTLYFSFS